MPSRIKYFGENRLSQTLTLLKNEFDKKVDKETGKGLSTNDFTDSYKNQLDGLGTSSTKDYTNTFDEDGVEVTTGKAIADAINTEGIIDTPSQIMSFADGSDSPMKSCTVSIEPAQDLHGYDRPWAGGAGKNLLNFNPTDQTKNGVTIKKNSDGSFKLNGTATDLTIFQVDDVGITLDAGTYTFSGVSGGSTSTSYWFELNNPTGTTTVSKTFANPTTFTLTENSSWGTVYFACRANTTFSNMTIKPMIELGSTVTAYEPYSNICPITGHDEVSVEVVGANLWDEECENGFYDKGVFLYASDAICCKNKIPIKPNTTLYYVKNFDITTNFYYTFYDKDGNFLLVSDYDNVGRIGKSSSGAISVPNGAYYMTFNMGDKYGATYNNDISINYPSTDTEYHAYNPNSATYTTDLGMTVYGGTLDLVSGVLTVNKTVSDLGGLSWAKYADNSFYSDSLASVGNAIDGICERYKNVPYTSLVSGTFNGQANGRIYIMDSDYNEATAFKTAVTGTKMVYELATPQTYQLKPTQVRSLFGTNNVWSDSGEMNKIIYTKGTTTLSLTIADLYNIIASLDARVKELEGEDEVDLSTMSDEDLDAMPEEEEVEEETAEET